MTLPDDTGPMQPAGAPAAPSRDAGLDVPGDWEEYRRASGWPTPNHMRRTADALDILTTPAKYGAILRWVADACDAALPIGLDVEKAVIPDSLVRQIIEPLIGLTSPAALAAPSRDAGLDAAWAEAEAALPEGWAITLLWGTITEDRWAASAGPWPTKPGDPQAVAGGPTPAAALLALAARLAADESRPSR